MSTRSGKRIHSSFHENITKADMESTVKSERKPRSKRVKDNINELSVSLFQAKKRSNYVRYPTDDEQNAEEVSNNDKVPGHGRVLRRNTLKEQNVAAINNDIIEPLTEPKNLIRKSRRVKKNTEEDAENLENEQVQVIEKPKSKKNRKKIEVVPIKEDPAPLPAKKSKRKKKKSKQSNSIVVEEVQHGGNSRNNTFNKSMSNDSFHSAAGSPNVIFEDEEPALLGFTEDTTFDNNIFDTTLGKRKSSGKDQVPMTIDADTTLQGIKKRKSNQQDITFEKKIMSIINSTNILETDADTDSITSDNSNNEIAKRTLNVNNGTYDKLTEIYDTSFEKDTGIDKSDSTHSKGYSKTVDTTFEKDSSSCAIKNKKKLSVKDTAFEKDTLPTPDKSARKCLRKSNIQVVTFDKNEKIEDIIEKDTVSTPPRSARKYLIRKSSIKDTIFDKNEKADNTTFEKDTISTPQESTKKSLSRQSSVKDTTFDKNENVDATFVKDTISTPPRSAKKSLSRQSSVKDTTFDKNENVDTTFVKDTISTPPRSAKKSLSRQSSVKDTTFDKNEKVDDTTFEKDTISTPPRSAKKSLSRQSSVKDTTFDKNEKVDDTTFEKDTISTPPRSAKKSLSRQSSVKDTTFDKNEKVDDTTFEKDTISTPPRSAKKSLSRQSSVKDTTFDKNEKVDTTFEKDKISTPQNSAEESLRKSNTKDSDNIERAVKKGVTRKSFVKDITFEESNISENNYISHSSKKRKYNRDSYRDDELIEKHDSTFNRDLNTELKIESESLQNESKLPMNDRGSKLNSTYEQNSKSSLISSDYSEVEKSNISCISITSDESENLLNTTPVLIESSMDNSGMSNQDSLAPQTPLKREGTFTKEGPEVLQNETPPKEESLPLAGCTPYHIVKSSQKRVLNVTRSVEKHLTAEPAPRMTRVMFCSPVDNPVAVAQEKRTIIKSNLKGSNKSFVFDDSVSGPSSAAPRKRSYTQSDADDARVKRKRLADDMQQSVDRLSRPRTTSATAKLAAPTTPSKKPATPSKSKSDAKLARTKLPNFSALHQRQFSKMESLGECQERKAKRAKQLLTPSGAVDMLERISPKGTTTDPQKLKEQTKKTDTPTKLPTLESLRPGFTRFGFKLNLEVNPFSVPSKHPETKPNGASQALPPLAGVRQALPSLAGATSVRRDVAKQAVMREKSFTDRRNVVKRNENRTIIKGVRTNRRFELQMKLRNID